MGIVMLTGKRFSRFRERGVRYHNDWCHRRTVTDVNVFGVRVIVPNQGTWWLTVDQVDVNSGDVWLWSKQPIMVISDQGTCYWVTYDHNGNESWNHDGIRVGRVDADSIINWRYRFIVQIHDGVVSEIDYNDQQHLMSLNNVVWE